MDRVSADLEYLRNVLSGLGDIYVLLTLVLLYPLIAKVRMLRRSRVSNGPRPLQNLVPLSAYDSDETGYWKRRFCFSAVGFGSCMIIPAVWTNTLTVFSPLVTAMLFAMMGLFFAIFLMGLLRAQVRFAVARLYSGSRRAVEPPPADLEAQYQLPCTWVHGSVLVGIGGVLYLGRKGLLFEADRRYLKNVQKPLEVIPLDGVTLTLAEPIPGRTAFQRFIMPRPLKPIELSWKGATPRIYVPRPAKTIEIIRNCIETLKRTAQ